MGSLPTLAALTIVLLATCSLTSSTTFTVPLTKLKSNGAAPLGIANRARARSFVGGQTTVSITNIAAGYVASIGFGSPPEFHTLILDTGSSNTWCGAITPYNLTSTSIPTGEAFHVTYGSGNVTGTEYLDQVTLAPNLVITNQSIGSANFSSGFAQYGIDGILGLGPVNLTLDTHSPNVNSTIPTILDNLVSQGLIDKAILGFYFAPSTDDSDTNGALTYGGTDLQLYEGNVTYVNLTNTYPSSVYWGINITSSANGNLTLFPDSTAGIVDTGTTGILLADDVFDTYMNAIPGATYNSTSQLLQIPPSSIPSMQDLSFVIEGKMFTLNVAAQLVPQAQNAQWGGIPGAQYGVVASTGYPSGVGLDFILGKAFLDWYYSIFDADAGRVGFARTNNTFAGTAKGYD